MPRRGYRHGQNLMQVPAGFWDAPSLAQALRQRDMSTLYRALQSAGMSQRTIAMHTDQAQSEITEIIAGRKVTSYDVLTRIADSLDIPRQRMGLAYATTVITEVVEVMRREKQRSKLVISEEEMRTGNGAPSQIVIDTWTGANIAMFRRSLRMSIKQFAGYVGVSDRMVCKWERQGVAIRPRSEIQSALDQCLRAAPPHAKMQLMLMLRGESWAPPAEDAWIVNVAIKAVDYHEAAAIAMRLTEGELPEVDRESLSVSPASSPSHRYPLPRNT